MTVTYIFEIRFNNFNFLVLSCIFLNMAVSPPRNKPRTTAPKAIINVCSKPVIIYLYLPSYITL